MHKKISVVLTVLNGEKTIKKCLESVRWADEIVVVDDGSTDGTVTIAKTFTDKIYPHKSQGFVEPARNFAIAKATGDYILVMDADEIVPARLSEKLQTFTQDLTVACVRIPRKNIIFNKWIRHAGWWPDYHIRFFKKGSVVWSDKIHSHPEIKGLVVDLGPEEDMALLHYNYNSVSQFLKKLDSYTNVTADEKIKANEDFHWSKILSAPFEEFLSRYFARQGYKDGLHGLVLSILMAVYEMVIYLKIWERMDFFDVDEKDVTEEFKKVSDSQKKLHFWLYSKKIEEASSMLKKNLFKTRRKFGI